MSDKIIGFPKPVTTDHHFGGCPICGGTDGYINSGPNHWFVCAEHRVRWYAGFNLFTNWREETAGEQLHQRLTLEGFIEVEPIYPKATE